MVQAVDTLPADLPIPDAVAVLQQGRHQVYPIVEASGRLVGMVSRADALAWRVEGGLEAQTLAERAPTRPCRSPIPTTWSRGSWS
jgi:CIC family chloride channel protein